MTAEKLSHYRILKKLGAGGMGEVYLAEDTQLDRKVAIKFLPPESIADEQAKRRLIREARAAAKLDHPNICSIHEVGEADGHSFIVMQHIEGETLASRIHRKPLELGEALEIATRTADALSEAHSRGIIHRDIKPANIMITSRNQVKVMDFGLAKMIREELVAESEAETQSILTTPGVIVGTVPYMSPEQVRGEQLDARSDIFSFGVVIYEMLSGHRPFVAESPAGMISAILTREPPPLAIYVDVPPELQRIVRKCLVKDRDERYQSTRDLSIDLRNLKRESETDTTTLATPKAATESRITIHRSAIVAFIAAALALVGIGAYLLLGRSSRATTSGWSTARTIATQLTNYGGTEAAGALSPDGKSFVFVSEHGGTPDIWLRQIAGGEPVRLTNDAAEEADPIYAPDGDTIYFTRIDTTGQAIWRIGVLGGQARRIFSNARKPAPSPDGRSLAYFAVDSDGTMDALVVSALDGSGTRTLAPSVFGGGLIIRPAWSPDGRHLSYIQRGLFAPNNLFVVEVSTGQARQVTRFTRSGEGVESQAWLPDNRHLVVSYAPQPTFFQTDLGVLDVQDGSISRLTFNVAQTFGSLSVSADGTRLIATADQTRREVWKVPLGPDPEANGRAAVRVLDNSLDPMWTFVPRDGRTLLFNNAITGTRNLWTMPLDRSAPPRQITAIAGDNVMHSSLSPDGSRVVFASRATGNSDIWTQNVDGSDLRQLTDDEAADS